MVAGRYVVRGLNEATLGELASGNTRPFEPTFQYSSRRLSIEFHMRAGLACAPLVLALFSLGATAGRRKAFGPVVTGLAASAISFGYYTAMFFAREAVVSRAWVPGGVAGWAPDLMFMVIVLPPLLTTGSAVARSGFGAVSFAPNP